MIDGRPADVYEAIRYRSRRPRRSGAIRKAALIAGGRQKTRLPKLVGFLAILVVYWIPVRRWFNRWGTTPEELARAMAGDGLIGNPTNTATGAITVNARPGDIWPWLVQMGTGRGGFYSYDWLDRLFGFLDRPSATRILPEFQHLAVGDKIPWGRDELTVSVLEPLRALALSMDAHGMEWVWQFGLYPLDDQRTRLVNRGTERTPNTPLWWLGMRIMEPAAFIMTRRFMLCVKQRGEMLRASSPSATVAPPVAPAAGDAHEISGRERDGSVGAKHLGRTPPFRGAHGEVVPGSIAEIAYRRLGGLDQWVMIRGESVANPPLIMLHGGPGLSETGLFRYFNASLERSFTVVYWDQRGAGKSFDRGVPRSSMTVEQFISDLDELVDAVCERLGKTKVAIFGHSWGSALGVLYAARFPEKVAAYVGSGQIGDWAAGEQASYEFALAEAQRRANRRAVRKLEAIGSPPYPAAAVFTERTWVVRFEGGMRPKALWKMGRAILGAHESSILELPNTMRAFRFSMNAMWAEVSRLNLIELAPALQMPVVLFLGRHDHFVPPQTSMAYFDALSTPSKKLVWFEHSGHEQFVDEPNKFNAATAELVRPLLPPEPPARGYSRSQAPRRLPSLDERQASSSPT